MCHVFHKCQWYCCRWCALPYDLRNSSVFSARLNASSDDSDVIAGGSMFQTCSSRLMLKASLATFNGMNSWPAYEYNESSRTFKFDAKSISLNVYCEYGKFYCTVVRIIS